MKLTLEERLRLYDQLEEVFDHHCRKCQYGASDGSYNDDICLNQCEVSKWLQEIGKPLDDTEIRKYETFEMDVSEYHELKAQRLSDEEICNVKGVARMTLHKWKKRHRIQPKRGK